MNKTQLYTLSSALLASTALASTANAGTIGRFANSGDVFTTVPVTISTSVFSTTASTANGVTIGGVSASEANFGMRYTNNFSGTTRWTTEFTITGARFITAGLTTTNVTILLASNGNTSTISASMTGATSCATVTSLVDLFVVNDCAVTGGNTLTTSVAYGVKFTGVTFNNASGLATAGGTVTLTGRVYNPTNTSQIFEASSTGTVISAINPYALVVTAGATATASATTTPIAFSNLSQPNDGSLSLRLVTLQITGQTALGQSLNATNSTVATTTAGTTSISVASSVLSSTAVQNVRLDAQAGGSTNSTLANFSGGTVTFTLTNTIWAAGNSANIVVSFTNSQAIPAAAAGTLTASIQADQQAYTATGQTAAINQGGFRAEINTFNASTNGPFGSYLRIHNNGQVAGTVTVTVRNDATGETLGSSYTTSSIAPNSTVQFSALQIETGANIPTASRSGSYTVSVTGPIVGYAQHILFDGNSVADLSGFRNSGSTDGRP
ncbi:MAG: hypothetical protein LCH56_01285 [Proteobacteria bacterium]|nr:hypothetical protein [Pseudomonadota bacterium]